MDNFSKKRKLTKLPLQIKFQRCYNGISETSKRLPPRRVMSKKNVVWWVGMKNKDLSDKYGGFEYFEYSRKTWEYWCKKNDVLFVPFEEPVEKDIFKFRVNL